MLERSKTFEETADLEYPIKNKMAEYLSQRNYFNEED